MEGNLGFLIAGYLLTWAVLTAYAWRLVRRSREAWRAVEARRGEEARYGTATGEDG